MNHYCHRRLPTTPRSELLRNLGDGRLAVLVESVERGVKLGTLAELGAGESC
jgi:hypothetical protein